MCLACAIVEITDNRKILNLNFQGISMKWPKRVLILDAAR